MKNRPAELAGVSGALAALIGHYALGVDDPVALTYGAVVIGVIPAAVTTYINAGGLRGVARLLWRGRSPR